MNEQQYTYRISAISDGKSTSLLVLTKREADIISGALDALGDEINEDYAPMVYLEKVSDDES